MKIYRLSYTIHNDFNTRLFASNSKTEAVGELQKELGPDNTPGTAGKLIVYHVDLL